MSDSFSVGRPGSSGRVPGKPAAGPAGEPTGVSEAAAPEPVARARAEADKNALSMGASRVEAKGKRELAAYAPEDDEAGLGGPTFSSKGLVPPGEAGPQVVQQAGGAGAKPGFRVTVDWAAAGDTLAPAGVGVVANDRGERVDVDKGGEVRVGGQPLDAPPEEPYALAGGGSVTNWGGGYVVVESQWGDSVSAFAKGDQVAFMGQMSDLRPGMTPGGG